ncbi:MAG: fibrobacter succinogenes major paralogous domain-containing protein [Odoribacteraceae bacterium]|nr:fibrobacter succinogenes major paralogous domain-containing protein [Odoribacteraceae bacterium]
MNGERDYGYYWSATPINSTDGRYLYFSAAYVHPQYTANRSRGFSARCIQE